MDGDEFAFRLADVGEGLHEAEIKRWLVQVGDRVALDQPLVEIETDKAVVELPAPVAGVVSRLGAAEGAIVHVGELVALIDPEHEAATAPAPPATAMSSHAVTPAHPPQDSGLKAQGSPRRPLATPAVRKLARDLGVDLAEVPGSGPGGRVLAGDVEGFAQNGVRAGGATAAMGEETGAINRAPTGVAADVGARLIAPSPAATGLPDTAKPTQPPPTGSRLPLRGLRRRIAQTMTQAWTTIPHITGFDEVEVSRLVAARERLRTVAETRGARLTYLPFVVKAVTVALREQPVVNASLDEEREEIVLHGAINVGIATATPDGLIVPVLHDAAGKTLLELQRAIDALTERARARTATPAELRGGTFTITNFGALGGWQAAPIIRPGEAAILGVGRIQERPWVVEGRVESRPVLALSLSADHRLIDGDVSTAFLTRVGSLLSDPALMLLDLM